MLKNINNSKSKMIALWYQSIKMCIRDSTICIKPNLVTGGNKKDSFQTILI